MTKLVALIILTVVILIGILAAVFGNRKKRSKHHSEIERELEIEELAKDIPEERRLELEKLAKDLAERRYK